MRYFIIIEKKYINRLSKSIKLANLDINNINT